MAKPQGGGLEVPATAQGLLLHLGCGDQRLEGWLNLDLPDVDITKRLPFHDRSVAAVFLEHVIEHVTVEEAIGFFDECLRILKPGGVLRLAFPNLTNIYRMLDTRYLQKGREENWHDGTVRGAMREIALEHGHRNVWHPEDMLVLLNSRGYFAEQRPPGESDFPFLQGAEQHAKAIGDIVNLAQTVCIEAVKPPDGSGGIPRIFHAIWLGPKSMPPEQAAWMEGWKAVHPHWDFILWTDDNLPLLQCPHKYNEAMNYAQKSDILRFEVLYRYGGVYLDTDMECLQPLDGLITGLSGFLGYEQPGRPAQGIIGAAPGHPFIKEWLHTVGKGGLLGGDNNAETGPDFTGWVFSRWLQDNPVQVILEDAAAEKESGLLCRDCFAVFHPWVFYPYWWKEKWERTDHPHAYAAHHWAGSHLK